MIQGAAFRVLVCFYNSDSRNFVELCEMAGYPTDLGGYYIRQLVEGGYLEKTGRGQYRIQPKGKQQLALYYGKRLYVMQPRTGVIIISRQEQSFITLRRKVQPFIGAVEWPAGVVTPGESIQDAAKRILRDRLGIESVEMILQGFFRRIDMYGDKVFAVHTCTISTDIQPSADSTVGENLLLTSDELQKVEKPSRSLLDILSFADTDSMLEERTYKLTADDLTMPSS